MNKLILTALACSVLLFSACEQDGLTLSFDVPYSTDFELKASDFVNTQGVPVSVSSGTVSTDVSEIGDQGTNLDKLESAKLNSAVVTVTSPDGQSLSFIDQVDIYISGQDIPEKLFASATDIADGATTITMTIEDVELVEYIRSGEFTARASFSTDEDLENDCTLKADLNLKVSATAL
jgi:hypothetical protein